MKHAEWNREVTNHDIINYQRRHRKWALEQAKYWLYWAINNIRWEHKETLKAEAEVERYKNIVKSKSPKKWEITSWIDRCNKAETDLSRQRRLRKRSIDFARFSYLKRCMAEEEVEGLILQGVQTEARAEKAEADKAKLVEALEYYADPHNYREDDWGVVAVIAEYGEAGKKARAVLKEVKL
ncbi:hypothetical protein LCGC14_1767340 [marine sediment metagenome]|uniref:Uncharacterized protein n=1 Tax=marine sediment metagenome TaxID=412755 RepID=A0A0F9GZ78_9ZZZZ